MVRKLLRKQKTWKALRLPGLVITMLVCVPLLVACDAKSDSPSATLSATTQSQTDNLATKTNPAISTLTPTSDPTLATPTISIPTASPTSATLLAATPTFSNPFPTPNPAIKRVDLVTAWGSAFKKSVVPMAIGENHVFILDSVTPDAKFLVGPIMPRRRFGSEAGELVLLEVSTRQPTVIHKLPTPATQVIGAAVDNDWVVWSEAAHQPDFGDWILYSYNRSTRQVKQVAQTPVDKDNKPLNSSFVLPKLDHNTVVWQEGNTAVTKVLPIGVKSADLLTGQITTLAELGGTPVISWPYIGWVEATDEPSKQVEGAAKGVIVILNLQTSVKKTLKKPDTPFYFNMYQDTVVWITSHGKEVMLTDVNETYSQVIAQAERDDTLQFPTISERLVAWTSYTTEQVWDRVQKRLITLEAAPTSALHVNGKAFVWGIFGSVEQSLKDKRAGIVPNTTTYYVTDSSQLPTEVTK